ncbi:MAG: DUF932 domain-containing protein [Proteobacteria bacterium]|nr:DUF932 domain-containing protein [Pseudomonadota bacterium]
MTKLQTATRQIKALKGSQVSSVSSQWFNRPDDQRFLTLDDLVAAVKARSDTSASMPLDLASVEFGVDETGNVQMGVNGSSAPLNNWSFGQVSSMLKAPAGYLRSLPPEIAAVNLQTGAALHQTGELMAYVRDDPDGGQHEVRAVTSPNYGRIHDYEVAQAVQRVAKTGNWKVPGEMRRLGVYNPSVDVTKDNTTLYASDRDVFMFLGDDQNPIEIAPDDPMFRGFYVWNSEVGSKTFGIATMYLRAVCCNRILWGVEQFQEIVLRHTANAPARFYDEAGPALEGFAAGDPKKVIAGVKKAKKAVVAKKQEDQIEFLVNLNFSAKAAADIVKISEVEEGHPPASVWDMAQGITAYARGIPNQDRRIETEKVAQKLLDQVVA